VDSDVKTQLEDKETGTQDPLRARVEKVLGEIRPYIQMDGGDIRLVDIKEGVVKVALSGACEGCAMAAMTLKAGVEQKIRQEIPEIVSVETG
jgi:Fe-S cluster biogenesis protein NfuA